MFLTRRLIYALVIVFMDEYMLLGVYVIMVSSLIMLAYALAEHQWNEMIINHQHIFDECVIYAICLLLLCFSSFVNALTRWTIGYLLMGLCFVYVMFNTIVIIYYSLSLIGLYIKRVFI